jgi:hypothetical protein
MASIIMLGVIVLTVIMLSVFMVTVIMLNFIILNGIKNICLYIIMFCCLMLIFQTLSVTLCLLNTDGRNTELVTLNVDMLSAVMQSVITLSVVIVSVIWPNVMAQPVQL